MATFYNARLVTTGLVFAFDAGNNKSYTSGSSTWVDLTGNANNGSLVDGTSYATSGSLVFDGTANRVHVTSPNNLLTWTPSGVGNNNISIETWVKTTDTSGNIISKPWNGNGEYNYRFGSNTLILAVSASSNSIGFTSVATGTWQHICVIITPTQFAVYRNGTLNAGFTNHGLTANIPAFSNENNNIALCIMSLYPYGSGWAGSTGFSIQGEMSILRFYNRVLSANEVLENYNATRSRFGV
jgi:hypothetical protein